MQAGKKTIFEVIKFFRLLIFSVNPVLNKVANALTIAIENPSDGKNKKRSAKIPPSQNGKSHQGSHTDIKYNKSKNDRRLALIIFYDGNCSCHK